MSDRELAHMQPSKATVCSSTLAFVGASVSGHQTQGVRAAYAELLAFAIRSTEVQLCSEPSFCC